MPNSLWSRVILAKYGEEGSVHVSAWWKGVQDACGGENGWFEEGVQKEVRSGNHTKFWLETWSGVGVLREKFYRLYNLSRQKWATVSECGAWRQGSWSWDFQWRRPLVGRELGWIQNLIHHINVVSISAGVPDKWVWQPGVDGSYSVNSAFLFLQVPLDQPLDPVFKTLWRVAGPSNVKAFAWRDLLNRVPTLENLLKRNVIQSPVAATCKLCLQTMETCSHLLFSCPLVYDVWCACFKWLGYTTVLPMDPKAHFWQFQFGKNTVQNQCLSSIWLAVLWSVWLHRNEVIFRSVEVDLSNILDMVKLKSWQWCNADLGGFGNSLFEWFTSPMMCIQTC